MGQKEEIAVAMSLDRKRIFTCPIFFNYQSTISTEEKLIITRNQTIRVQYPHRESSLLPET